MLSSEKSARNSGFLLIITGWGESGKVILQVSIAVFSGAVEKNFGQRWLSPPRKIGPYAVRLWKCWTWKWRTIKIAGHEIAGHEIDGQMCRAWNSRTWQWRTNLQDMKLQDMKLQDMKMQDVNMTNQKWRQGLKLREKYSFNRDNITMKCANF